VAFSRAKSSSISSPNSSRQTILNSCMASGGSILVAVDPRLQDLQLIEVGLWFDEQFAAPKAIHDVGELVGFGKDEIHPLSVRLLHRFNRNSQNGNSRR